MGTANDKPNHGEGAEQSGPVRAYRKRQDAEGGSRAAARDATISVTISSARNKANVSQERCAQYLGVSRPFYAKFELGNTTLSVGQIEALLDLLKVERAAIWARLRGEAPTLHVAVAPGETVNILVEGGKRTGL